MKVLQSMSAGLGVLIATAALAPSSPGSELAQLAVKLMLPASSKSLSWDPSTDGLIKWSSSRPSIEDGDNVKIGVMRISVGQGRYADWIVQFETNENGPMSTPPDQDMITPPSGCSPAESPEQCGFDLSAAVPTHARLICSGKGGHEGSIERRYMLTASGRKQLIMAVAFMPKAPNRGIYANFGLVSSRTQSCSKPMTYG